MNNLDQIRPMRDTTEDEAKYKIHAILILYESIIENCAGLKRMRIG